MLIKFHKTGKVALNYGVSGTIDVEAGEVRDIIDAHALILIDRGVATKAEATKDTKEVLNGAKVADNFIPDVEPKEEPKKRGRKPKVK